MATSGEPLQFLQKTTMKVGDGGLETTTDFKIQFARVDPKDAKKVLRPDGKPFPTAPPP